jgi:hypothetical protein
MSSRLLGRLDGKWSIRRRFDERVEQAVHGDAAEEQEQGWVDLRRHAELGGVLRHPWSREQRQGRRGRCRRTRTEAHSFSCGSRAPIPNSPSQSWHRTPRTSPSGSAPRSRRSAASTSPRLRRRVDPSSCSTGRAERARTGRARPLLLFALLHREDRTVRAGRRHQAGAGVVPSPARRFPADQLFTVR